LPVHRKFWRLLAKSADSAAPRTYEVFGIVAARIH
jgi:hypothetical protein